MIVSFSQYFTLDSLMCACGLFLPLRGGGRRRGRDGSRRPCNIGGGSSRLIHVLVSTTASAGETTRHTPDFK